MADNIPKNNVSRPMNNNRSNTVRSVVFMFLMLCFAMFLISNMNNNNVQKTEVPISEVIQRANNPNGNIKKITVVGSTLEITLKGQDKATETSRKDASGTLYEQGLVNYCDGMEGEELTKCQETYPVIEYKEDLDVWGIVLDVALTILPINDLSPTILTSFIFSV